MKFLQAMYRVSFYKERLIVLLRARNLSEEQLPSIQKSLEQEARSYLGKNPKIQFHFRFYTGVLLFPSHQQIGTFPPFGLAKPARGVAL